MTNPPAGFFLRLLAWSNEKLIFFSLTSILLLNISTNTSLNAIYHGLIIFLIFIVFYTLFYMLYSVAITYYLGGDLGKLITGLRVKDQSGNRLNFKKILFRQLLAYRFSALILGLGYLSIIKDPKKQAWHDKTVDSNVFRVTQLVPLGLIVFVLTAGLNGYLIKTSLNNFINNPAKQEVLGLAAAFNQQIITNQNIKNDQISTEIINDQKQIYSLLDAKKNDEASKSARIMLTKSSSNAEKALSYQTLGDVALSGGSPGIAKMFYLESLNYSAKLPFVYSGLSETSVDEKNYPQAEDYINRSIALSPNIANSYYRLGVIKLLEGDKTQAIINLKKAVSLDPTNQLYKSDLEKASLGGSVTVSYPTLANQSTQTSSVVTPVGVGYTAFDGQKLVSDMNQADKDSAVIKSYPSNYNQQTIQKVLQIITQRKILAQQLLDKMSKGETFTQADFTIWDQYDALFAEQNSLVQTFYNGNGGN